MAKKTAYTVITPLPANIPRQLAIDMLHSHGEILELNPLVIDYKPIDAPKNAAADEFFAVWYEITERIQYMPGLGKLGSGKIKFKGVFHNTSWGLQTHTYAPAGVSVRNKWQICGNQAGEPRQVQEMGAPNDGLYLKEDIEIECNMTMTSFVKKEMKAATATMVKRLIVKAELLDSGALMAMFDNGMLKTMNPAVDQSMAAAAAAAAETSAQRNSGENHMPQPSPSFMPPMKSPTFPSAGQPMAYDPRLSNISNGSSQGYNGNNSGINRFSSVSDAYSRASYQPPQDQGQYPPHDQKQYPPHDQQAQYGQQAQYAQPPQQQQMQKQPQQNQFFAEMEAPMSPPMHPPNGQPTSFAAELE